jgi:hypothetical protein
MHSLCCATHCLYGRRLVGSRVLFVVPLYQKLSAGVYTLTSRVKQKLAAENDHEKYIRLLVCTYVDQITALASARMYRYQVYFLLVAVEGAGTWTIFDGVYIQFDTELA